jgi:hypothetical protein
MVGMSRSLPATLSTRITRWPTRAARWLWLARTPPSTWLVRPRLGVGEIDHYSRQAESAFAEAMAAVGAIADAQKATKIATARAALADAGLPEAAINALMALNGQL